MAEAGFSAFFIETNDEFAIQLMNSIASANGRSSGREYFGNDFYDFAKFFDFARDSYNYVMPLTANGTTVIVPRSKYCRIGRALVLGVSNIRILRPLYASIPNPDLIIYLKV
jgi:hypothetical protein